MSAAATTRSRPSPPAGGQIRNSLTGTTPNGVTLPCRVRLADGRTFSGELPAVRHRALQLGMLHADSDGLVEIAVGFRRDGKLTIPRRRYSQFLAGGKAGGPGWLEELLATAERHCRRRGAEVFVAPPVRATAAGDKHAVTHTWALWVDVDKPGQLHRLWALLAERPCHLLVESGGSGGAHAYWLLEKALPASKLVPSTGELTEPIERAHLRLLHHLGVDGDGNSVGDRQCQNRSRLMRLAGTVNTKTGRHARIIHADLELPRYPIEELVGDLPDPPRARIRRPGKRHAGEDADPYKRIPPPEYFEVLAGINVPPSGRVRCPSPSHPDRNPSCDVGSDAEQGWICRSCQAGGAIYDLASVLLDGPTGHALRGEEFKRARAYVHDAFGELT